MATERTHVVTLGGNPVTLVGTEIKAGFKAPDFEVLSPDLEPVTLASSRGSTRILLSILSVDTSVCDTEIKELADRASDLPSTEILVVSADLPFTQKRWCAVEGVDNVKMGSDHREMSFGLAYGTLMKEHRQLARAAFVVNPAGEVTYAEYVPEAGEQPDFDAIVQAAKEAAASPA